MDWKYVKPLTTENNINDFERRVSYVFPDDFKNCVIQYNGGRPEKRVFDTAISKERVLKSLLSFNPNDRETVWKALEWNSEELTSRYVAFAMDNFGNLICFDSNDGSVVFINHEDLSVEHIADTFSLFLSLLRE